MTKKEKKDTTSNITSKSHLFESLIRSSYAITETLIETYFKLSSDNITDDEIQKTLKDVSEKLRELLAEVQYQINTFSRHK